MGVWYSTREDVKSALDIMETARNNTQVDRALEAASRAAEGFLHRTFAPILATRYFNWPNHSSARAWRLWLLHNDLISVTSITTGGVSVAASDYFLEPVNEGPPYDSIEIDLSSTASFEAGDTHQRSISVIGLWGYSNDETTVGATAEALDASETAVDVDGPTAARIGVGSVVRVDSERMLVTERGTLTTGQTLQSDLDALDNDVTVAVTTGSSFTAGETILLGSERMLIVDIAGNNLTVRRAWDGSILAAHSGDTIYAYRTLTVTRGALGTTAATHDSGASVVRWDVPGALRDYVMAEAINSLVQSSAGYSGVSGSENNRRRMSSPELISLRDLAYRVLARKGRTGAV
jgi:hypothetical protein